MELISLFESLAIANNKNGCLAPAKASRARGKKRSANKVQSRAGGSGLSNPMSGGDSLSNRVFVEIGVKVKDKLRNGGIDDKSNSEPSECASKSFKEKKNAKERRESSPRLRSTSSNVQAIHNIDSKLLFFFKAIGTNASRGIEHEDNINCLLNT